MKKSRTLIIALLLVATLCVGIGYAAFSTRMAVNGSALLAGVDESKVVFTGAVLDDESTHGVSLTVTGTGEVLSVSVKGFDAVGEVAIVEATIENPHAFEVALTTPAIRFVEQAGSQVETNDYFDVQIVGTAPTSVPAAADGANGTTTLTFKVTSKVAELHADNTTVNFIISFMAQAGTQA